MLLGQYPGLYSDLLEVRVTGAVWVDLTLPQWSGDGQRRCVTQRK